MSGCRRCFLPVLLSLLFLIHGGCFNDAQPEQRVAAVKNDGSAEPAPVVQTHDDNGLLTSIALAKPQGESSTRFVRLKSTETGVDYLNPIDNDHPLNRLFAASMACGAVAIGDLNGDDQPDLFFTSGPRANKLYLRTGPLKYSDVTARAGVAMADQWSTGAAMADVDGDGDLDLYVACYDTPNRLFINNGSSEFTERADAFGLDIVDASLMPSFCDYDADGDLDCYLTTYRYYHERGTVKQGVVEVQNGVAKILPEYQRYYQLKSVRLIPDSDQLDVQWEVVGRPDQLLRNNGDGTFTDVSEAANVAGTKRYGSGNSATWFDANDDGFTDLYVANDYEERDYFYLNNGDGTFREALEESVPHTTWFSMGADFADLNRDGRFDLLVTDMSGTNHYKQKTSMGAMGAKADFLRTAVPRQYMRNALFVNTGTPRFQEAAYLAGLANSNWTWSVQLSDFDNDGLPDVFITNGVSRNFNDSDNEAALEFRDGETEWARHIRAGTPPLKEENLAFRNIGDLKFKDTAAEWNLDWQGMSYGSAHADLDRDGDLDLVVANLDDEVAIYRNDSTQGNRLLLTLEGQKNNRFGIGAQVEVEANGLRQIEMLTPVRGFQGSHEPRVHFGLGDAKRVERLSVRWPGGKTQTFEDLPVNRYYTLRESPGSGPKSEVQSQSATVRQTQFVSDTESVFPRHFETYFDDFARQPLLPNQYSQLGPGVAVGDIDGDGDDDLVIAGAAGHPSRILIRDDGSFRPSTQPALDSDSAPEDLAPLLFDADSDGDPDLLLVTGGVECEPDSDLLLDRLYLNDGNGQFTPAPKESLPKLRDSGSTAAAADFDRDGDLDLVIAGRVIPGDYPLPAESRILRNEGGKFVDVTVQVAKDLQASGLATSVLWSDANDDGWIDLLVAYEWGPIRLLLNKEGVFEDTTTKAGLAEATGWYNGLAGRDLDNDGDIDYVATNFGLNTKYHASVEKPALLYYGDFDGSGKRQLVEAEFENETLFPVRGRSCSSRAIPVLADRFTSYHDFAVASLQEIYTPKCLGESHRFAATNLESIILLNDGRGRFKIKPLPRSAQIAPGFGVVLTEVNGDAFCDLYLVHNFFTPQIETGRMDGGLSQLLTGRGDGTFDPIKPAESGLIVPGDAKGVAAGDFNADGTIDFFIGMNDAAPYVLISQAPEPQRFISVRLEGKKGNPSAVGAKVTLVASSGVRQTAEVQAGGGYMSQSSSTIVFGIGPESKPDAIEVRWPDGNISIHTVGKERHPIKLRQPSAETPAKKRKKARDP